MSNKLFIVVAVIIMLVSLWTFTKTDEELNNLSFSSIFSTR